MRISDWSSDVCSSDLIATNLDYPLNIGGRPLIAWQAFALIGFELTVLFSVLFMVVGFFVLNRLPRYHYPLFDIDNFEHVTRDGFFLFIPATADDAVPERRAFLERLQPLSIEDRKTTRLNSRP